MTIPDERAPEIRTPQANDCYLAYADILGFAQVVADAEASGDITERAMKISRMLRRATGRYDRMMDAIEEKRDEYQQRPLQVFSDIIWYAERVRENERNVFSFVNRLLVLNAELAANGIFVRGALVQGDHFDDRNLVFSPALIAAYEHERKNALYPRIVVSEHVGEAYLRSVERRPQREPDGRQVLWHDKDGWLFINYLAAQDADRELDEEKRREQLETHRQHIEKQLCDHKHDPYIRAKYLWSASYHNRYLREHYGGAYPEELVIADTHAMGPCR